MTPFSTRRAPHARLAAVTLVSLSFSFGCVFGDSIRYAELPPTAASHIQVLGGPPQDRPYKVVGQVMMRAGSAASWDKILDGARKEAAALGADAIYQGQAGMVQIGSVIVPGGSSTTANSYLDFQTGGVTTNAYTYNAPSTSVGLQNKQWIGMAIVYVDRAQLEQARQ